MVWKSFVSTLLKLYRVSSFTVHHTGPSSVPHTSFYPWSWLREHSYDPPMRRSPPPECVPLVVAEDLLLTVIRKILWGSKIQQSPPTVTYEEVMAQDDKGLFKWLSNIASQIPWHIRIVSYNSYRTSLDSRSFRAYHQRPRPRNICQQELVSSGKPNVGLCRTMLVMSSQTYIMVY